MLHYSFPKICSSILLFLAKFSSCRNGEQIWKKWILFDYSWCNQVVWPSWCSETWLGYSIFNFSGPKRWINLSETEFIWKYTSGTENKCLEVLFCSKSHKLPLLISTMPTGWQKTGFFVIEQGKMWHHCFYLVHRGLKVSVLTVKIWPTEIHWQPLPQNNSTYSFTCGLFSLLLYEHVGQISNVTFNF